MSNVDTVLVAGRIVKRRARLVGFDMGRVRREATVSRDSPAKRRRKAPR